MTEPRVAAQPWAVRRNAFGVGIAEDARVQKVRPWVAEARRNVSPDRTRRKQLVRHCLTNSPYQKVRLRLTFYRGVITKDLSE